LISLALLLCAFALAPAAIASTHQAGPSQESEPSAIPPPLRQPVKLDPVSPAGALTQAPAESELPDSKASDDHPEPRTADLAKESQNPIANLISVPFQNNTTFGAGPSGEGTPNLLNIQPVIPVPLSEELLLVTRTIVPVVNQPASATGQGSAFGLGDINPQFFFSPVSDSKVTWGVGPTFVLPTATDDVLGQGKWSAGPTAVVVVSTGPMVFGAIANNVWSFAGDRDRESVNQLLVQPFLNYNLPKGWYLVSAPIITSNWEAPAGEEPWTVPIGGGFGRVFAIGDQQVNASLQAYWNVVKPDAAGDWTLRAQVQLLFPR
jgi:hypothetical protein